MEEMVPWMSLISRSVLTLHNVVESPDFEATARGGSLVLLSCLMCVGYGGWVPDGTPDLLKERVQALPF